MEITTNLTSKDTVIWIGTAFEPANLSNYYNSNTGKIEGIYSLDAILSNNELLGVISEEDIWGMYDENNKLESIKEKIQHFFMQ